MNIILLTVGPTLKGFVNDGVNEYYGRLKHYINFKIETIANIKNTKNLTPSQIKEIEGENIISYLTKNQITSQNSSVIILLDEKGKEFKSTEFADYLQKYMNQGIKNLVFIVGGAYGFCDKIKEIYKEKLSISKMTFSHQMIRLLFTEQLYRGFTILKNEPYHNE